MLTCLFWNFNCSLPKKEEIAARVALHHDVNILVLSETTTDPGKMLSLLESKAGPFAIPTAIQEKVQPALKKGKLQPVQFQIFTRLPDGQLSLLVEGGRTIVWKLNCQERLEILLAFIHFYSKSNDRYRGSDSSEGQHSDSLNEYLTIHYAEDEVKHMRTLVIGDFNMNPFEKGMVDTNRFGAMMSRELAQKHSAAKLMEPGTRRFYNPTWSRMGRGLPEPPGTFYWNKKINTLNVWWHFLDQVLVRPALLEGFRDENFTILTSIPGDQAGEPVDLIRLKKKHWKIKFSDHLPILLKFELPRKESHHA